MQILIADPDEIAAHVLAHVARRRGHRAVAVRRMDDALGPLPVDPAACFLAAHEVSPEVLSRLSAVRDRHRDALLYLTVERRPGPATAAALQHGAADVLVKPYFPHEAILRAELAAASQAGRAAAQDVMRAGDIEVDLARYSAAKNGRELVLTKLELRLLHCLVEHEGRLAPTERLLSFGWETQEPPYPSLLKTHISHLRQKLQDAGGRRVEIRSRHSLGYVLSVAREDGA